MIEIQERDSQTVNNKEIETLRKRFSPSDQEKVYNQRPIVKKLVNKMKNMLE